ncbi:MAG TPA: hypothetical protein VHB21_18615, partial [Minicystis sp.]|nr:hypothetical protein [Minicystis sp.]
VVRASDVITGTGRTTDISLPLIIQGDAQVLTQLAPLAAAEVGALVPVGRFELGASLAFFGFPSRGPSFGHPLTAVHATPCEPRLPRSINCAPESSVVAGERAYGAFALFAPSLVAGFVL